MPSALERKKKLLSKDGYSLSSSKELLLLFFQNIKGVWIQTGAFTEEPEHDKIKE